MLRLGSMENHITRRHALALTSAALATSCLDNNRFLAQTVPVENTASLGEWSSSVPLPFPVQEIYPCAHNDTLHLAGGFVAENGRITGPTAAHHAWAPSASVFPEHKSWGEHLPLPVPRHHPHLVSFNTQLLAFGGFESASGSIGWQMQSTGWFQSGGVICLPPSRIQRPGQPRIETPDDYCSRILGWKPLAPLPAPCAEAVVGVTGDDSLHLAGGRTPKGEANANWNDHIDTDHHFVLADLNSQWETAAPCLTKRNSASGDVINGNLHIVGGRTVGGGNVATHEVYDHAEDRWRNATPMPQAQGGLAAAAVNGKLYTFGGEFFDNGGGVYKEAWAYDPATDAWSALPDMPNPRHGLGAVALDGKIYVIGGALQASGVDTSNIVDIFTPA